MRIFRKPADYLAFMRLMEEPRRRTGGFNHGLRAIVWRASGMRNFTHFRLWVLHGFG